MNIEDAAVHLLRNKNFPSNGTGLSLDPEYLVTGGNSGFQALNFGVLAGAKSILLLGYDAREPIGNAPSHWFGHHPKREPVAAYALYRQSMKAAAGAIKSAGVRVLNCSPGSAIDCFEKIKIEDALLLAHNSEAEQRVNAARPLITT
ncbi:MAG: hypothetical protein NUV34_01125 [Sulfuricaulis sp.]|nr:hypothetical protein [Sulfuricaulis sp.]